MHADVRRRLRSLVLIGYVSAAPGAVLWAHAAAAAVEPAGQHAASEESHGESVGAFLSRIANFAILAGGLWYLLRSPVGTYLEARGQQIRQGLQDAADMKANAARQMAEIDARVKALPGELAALRARGAEEVVAEEARIRQAAELERQRLVEQAQREIDLRLQAARRDLTRHAAELAVEVAATRLKAEMTDADQQRLVDRYVSDVRAVHD